MAPQPARLLRFGDFGLDVRAGELRKRGIKIRIPEQSFQILLMLLERPGEVVLRDEIRLKLWPEDTVVEFDHSINAAVKRLRDALGDSAEEPRYVETLAKRGYRFKGKIEAPAAAASEPVAADRLDHPLRRLTLLGTLLAGAAFAAVILGAVLHREKQTTLEVVRFTIAPPQGTAFGGLPSPAVSPDGRRFIFETVSKQGYQYWIRSLDSPALMAVPGMDRGSLSFWSPDGKWVGFSAGTTSSRK